MSKLRQNALATHEQLEADYVAGDPKAIKYVESLRGEINAGRQSLGLPPLPSKPGVRKPLGIPKSLDRKYFERCFPSTSQLRHLAKAISEYTCAQARSACFLSATPPPYNFLANGETTGYSPLTPIHCPLAVANWKFPGSPVNCCLERGFNDGSAKLSSRGLSLLFDPLVDAFLAANAGGASSPVGMPQRGSTVIVLSDYGSIYDPDIKLMGYVGSDWALEEANAVLNLLIPGGRVTCKTLDDTTRNLLNCVVQAYQNKYGCPAASIEEAIRGTNVLVWNFMPFLRGGSGSSGSDGLPRRCGNWKLTCWNRLCDFVAAVAPRQIVLAVNKNIIGVMHSDPSRCFGSAELARLARAISRTATAADILCGAATKIFAVNHPGPWQDRHGKPRVGKNGKSLDHSKIVADIINGKTP